MTIAPFLSLKEILEKDLAHGSKLVLITGKPGSGKTGLLIGLSNRLVDYEICIWRGIRGIHGDEFRFPGSIKVLSYQCCPEYYDGTGKKLGKIKVNVAKSYDELLRSCELGKLNILYMPEVDERKEWIKFARWMGRKRFPFNYASPYVSLFVDEIADLLPSVQRRKGVSKEVGEFLDEMKEFRNFIISLYSATQNVFDIDYLGFWKFQYRIYLPGAKVHRRERIFQKTVDSLKLGQGIISGSFFSQFVFGNYPRKQIVVVR